MSELHMEIHGDGPPLVLLHGWALNLRVFDPVVRPLAAHFTVHTIDLPGHGRSPGPLLPPAALGNAALGNAALAAIADRLLQRLPQRFYLCGWSLGGQLAMVMAARWPQRVASMTLVATTPRFTATHDWPAGARSEVLQDLALKLQSDPQRALRSMLELQVRGSVHATEVLATLQRALLEHGTADSEALDSGLQLLGSVDLRGTVSAIHVATLVIAGQYDRVTHPEAGRWLAERLPHGRYHEFARCGHAPFLSHPEQFAELLLLLQAASANGVAA